MLSVRTRKPRKKSATPTGVIPMIDSLKIKNFRCFRELFVEDFGTINVVVGDNGSGKTALLEAIFLSQAGTPEAAIRTRAQRGLGQQFTPPSSRDSYHTIWRDLFYQFRENLQIEISVTGTPENKWSLKIFYDPNDPSAIPISKVDGAPGVVNISQSDSASISPITFEHTNTDKKHVSKPMFSTIQSFLQSSTPSFQVPAAYFSSSFSSIVTPTEIANQFSELDKKRNRARPIISAIKKLYPRIQSLSVQTELGQSLLFCEVRGLREKVPIGVESGGTHKLTAYLLGIATQRNGVILIDEIENGFYYKKMPGVWGAIFDFCTMFNVQVFASTHSLECLQAIVPTMRRHEEKFRLIRVERQDKGRVVRVFKGDEFEAAIRTEAEIR